jgi:hypothetical protein
MKRSIIYSALGLLALAQFAMAQGPAGGTGAIASIPSSVVRAGEQKTPIMQSGLISILSNPASSNVDVYSTQKLKHRDEAQMASK